MTQPTTIIKNLVARQDILDGDVLLIKQGSPIANPTTLDRLMQMLIRSHRSHCILIVVGEFPDLTVLKEGEMNQYGWYRKREAQKNGRVEE